MGLEDKVKNMRDVKILTIDIETSPIIAYTWGPKWETNIIEFIEYGQVIGYSAKWYKGKQETKTLIDYKGYKPGKIDDKLIVKDIHKLIDEADVVITQNGVSFDMKYLNTRFMKHNLGPPSPYKNIDTKIEAKKYLRLPSNKLDDMGEYFEIGRKLEHEGFNLWLKCIKGDKKAWKLMADYNAQDVLLTEKMYDKLRPFMKTHPDVSNHSKVIACPKCNSTERHARGYSYTNSAKYQRYVCLSCNGWYRDRDNLKIDNKPGINL